MDLSAIVVHYHAVDPVSRAVAALRRDLDAAGLAGEVLLVDNGSRPEDRPRLAALGAEVLDPGANLGYAGGLNLGVARARGRLLLLMNADVEVGPGCLGALAGAVADGAAAAGPRFSWDAGGRLALPPTEERLRRRELEGALAAAGWLPAGWPRRRWRRHARRHWAAREPLASYALSGALLAVDREAWREVGPFDPAYRLYYEESDWLRRLERRGLPARYVPAARAVHPFGRSSATEPRAARWFRESEVRFRRLHYGAWFERCLTSLPGPGEPRWPDGLPPGPPELDLAGLGAGPSPLWIELSPRDTGYPAAAERLAPGAVGWELPPGVWEELAPGRYRLGVVDEAGGELAAYTFKRSPTSRPRPA